MSGQVPLREVERELKQRMQELQGESGSAFHRARMSNLIVFCDSLQRSIELNDDVPAISGVHPARIIFLVGEPGVERPLSARVTVRPLPRQQSSTGACVEMVTLHAGGSAVERLPFAVRSLLIGDLPVNLLWASSVPPPLAGVLMHELAEPAQQIIYDSIGWPDPVRGVAATAAWIERIERKGIRWRVASDINWRRLKYWRRLLAQTLDALHVSHPEIQLCEIAIEHGPHAGIQAWLLASWLAGWLGATPHGGRVTPGVEMTWQFRGPRGEMQVRIRRREEGAPTLHRVRLGCDPQPLVVTREGPQRLSVQNEGGDTAPRTVTVPALSAADLIGRQLSDREADERFIATMRGAQAMAHAVLGG
jgi:glucose-6-phosphate dehydrogenase assembly protein OpcA